MRYRACVLVCLCCLLSGCVNAGSGKSSSPRELTVRGTLSAVSPTALQLRERQGETLTLRLTPSSRLFGVFAASLDEVRPGAFLGVSALPLADGTLEAREIHLFSERLRGAGEGHSPLLLADGGEGSMTNGTVGAEGTLSGGDLAALHLVLRYEGGQQRVLVSPETPVVFVDSVVHGVLRPGQSAVLTLKRSEDQSTAEVVRAFVGFNGLVPPF